MTNKKQQINNASSFGSFDIKTEQPDSFQTGLEAAGIKPVTDGSEHPTKGAAAGCKPGTSRKTYVLPLEMIDKIAAVAAYTRRKEVAVVIDLLERGIASYEQEYGKEITTLPKF
jgi:hypothetical protein